MSPRTAQTRLSRLRQPAVEQKLAFIDDVGGDHCAGQTEMMQEWDPGRGAPAAGGPTGPGEVGHGEDARFDEPPSFGLGHPFIRPLSLRLCGTGYWHHLPIRALVSSSFPEVSRGRGFSGVLFVPANTMISALSRACVVGTSTALG